MSRDILLLSKNPFSNMFSTIGKEQSTRLLSTPEEVVQKDSLAIFYLNDFPEQQAAGEKRAFYYVAASYIFP